MARRSLATLSAIFVILALSPRVGAQAPSVDDLVARNLQAMGGREKMEAVTTLKQTGHVEMQGMQGTLTIYSKRPNLLRQEMKMGTMTVVNGFDGETAWIINPLVGSNAPIVMGGPEADEIKDQSSFDGPLQTYKAKGGRLELEGEDTLDGRKVEHLKLTDKAGSVVRIYLDAATALVVRLVKDVSSVTLTQDLLDYRDVDGLKVPFTIRTSVNGVPMGEITVDKIEFNVPMDDALFRMKR